MTVTDKNAPATYKKDRKDNFDTSLTEAEIFQLFDEIISKAKKKGADGTEVLLSKDVSLNQTVRLGKVEEAELAESDSLGIKIRKGKKESFITTEQLNRHNPMAQIIPLLERLFAMVDFLPDNPYVGEATPEQLFHGKKPDLQTFDPTELSTKQLLQMAMAMESSAMSVPNIVNSEGAAASFHKNQHYFAFSNGFRGSEEHSSFSLALSVIAEKDGMMESDWDSYSKVYLSDLQSPEIIGKKVALRAQKALGARQEKSGAYPVILESRIASSIIGYLARAINGLNIAKGISFLNGQLGKKIMADNINIIDDPLLLRGFGSTAYDGEGLPTRRQTLVENGVLKTWLLDLATSRQLNLPPTGHAMRNLSGVTPGLTNTHLAAGHITVEELMSDIQEGFYVTNMMGSGVNGVTGDFSQGASGFWVVNGKISHPVNEMTIAGNLRDMFLQMTPADDLEFIRTRNAPTLRIDGMVVAGK